MAERRQSGAAIWEYFQKSHSDKYAKCNLCGKALSYKSSSTNLKKHLKLKHISAYNNLNYVKNAKLKFHMSSKDNFEEDKGDVIYEYVVGSPASTGSNDSMEESNDKSSSAKAEAKQLDSSADEHIYLRAKSDFKGPTKRKKLIDQLTEEKIFITALQKELVEKELEEKNLKVQLLQAEMEHKKEMYELEKQEMLLKIEVLKANLSSNNVTTTG